MLLRWPGCTQNALVSSLALAEDGSLFIADAGNSCIRALRTDGVLETVAGVCGQRGFAGDSGLATEALLDRPRGVAVDRRGRLLIADTFNDRIRVVGL